MLRTLILFVAFLVCGCNGTVAPPPPPFWSAEEIRSLRTGQALDDYIKPRYQIFEKKIAHDGGFIFITTLAPRRPISGPSVYKFSGGPGNDHISEIGVRRALAVYGDIASKISFVAYSGSGGFDGALEKRLRRDGMASFEDDVAALAAVIDLWSEGGYIVDSGSLSTSIGLLTLSTNPSGHDDCALGVFLAPWTHYYPTDFVYDPANKPEPKWRRTLEDRADDYRWMAREFLHIDETVPFDDATPASDGRWWLASVRERTDIAEDVFVGIPSFENRMDRAVAIDFFEALPSSVVWKSDYDFHVTMGASAKAQEATRAFVESKLPLGSCEAD